MKELEDISVKIPITVPDFKDMSWIEKEMVFGQHIYYVDDNGIVELDPREVFINLKEV